MTNQTRAAQPWRNRFEIAILLTCLPGLLAAIAGCRPAAEPGSRGPGDRLSTPDGVIGLSVLTSDNPFFDELADGLREAAAEYNYDVIVTAGQQKPLLQDQQVDDFITKQVHAIVLCPCDSRAVGATIEKANRAGIPVFTADIASMADTGEVVCHVATDNRGGGEAAAEAVIEMLGGRGNVAVLNHPRIESAILREEGFKGRIEDAPEIKVATTLPGGGERKMSFDSAKDALQTHPDLDGFFCINDPSALGAIRAIQELKKTDQIKVVGFDAQPEARRAVKDGALYATIVQYPREIGRKTAEVIHEHLLGKEVEPEILIPVTIYRKSDADADPELQGRRAE
jgi:ribose transport system substrate-binding protein